jgi:magnesium-transporting ATPase (P-type)
MLQSYDDISDNINSKEKYIKNIITALALCHNVTPVFNEEKTEKSYQASSPD